MNIEVFNFLHSLAGKSPLFDGLIIFIAEPFGYILIVISYMYLFFHFDADVHGVLRITKKIREITILSVSVVIAWSISLLIKILVSSPRPFILLSYVQELFVYGAYDSFPSGHATFFSALAAVIFIYHRKAGYIFAFCALLIGLSRIIAGIHFPFDIVAGFVLGSSLSVVIYYTINKFISTFFPKIDFLSKKP